ncbi:MAG: WecB/TagA/CpsF family glycosyltransferase [Ruminiclostridium sp.]|nr:WecB/TagA/CpsF family glycosyltransferase [Ruminiclostridium sp.]
MRNEIMGVSFDNLTLSEAIQKGADLAAGPGFSYVVTPNPEIVNMGREMPDYRDILNNAALVLPDGIGVIHAAKILGTPLKERVPGIDFATGLLSELEKTGGRLFLLGAKPGVADQAAENLKKKYPKLTICGTNDGYFKDSAPVVEKIKAAQADVAFVCLGAPKQERWIAEYGPQTGAHLMVGLGGVLDVYAGNVKRAPVIWQKMGLEWFYRLVHQPSRFGRMAKLPLFLVDAKKESKKRGKA